MKLFSVFFFALSLLGGSAVVSATCIVNGKDTGKDTLTCGKRGCKGARVTGCKNVICSGKWSCDDGMYVDSRGVKDAKLTCSGSWSCQESTFIGFKTIDASGKWAAKIQNNGKYTTLDSCHVEGDTNINCRGSWSCQGARMSGMDKVSCGGSWACKNSKKNVACGAPPATSGGDPHFLTFGDVSYDFHGGCDLVLFEKEDFDDGVGLTVHIRTQIKKTWSHIKSAAIRIGDHVLELSAERDQTLVRWNGAQKGHNLEPGEASLGHYPVKFVRINGHQTRTRIDLGGKLGDAISVDTFKEFVRVNFSTKTHKKYVGSRGLLGSYPNGEMLARDGNTRMENATDAFGQEWRVGAGDRMLFHDADPAGLVGTCNMPDLSKSRRRLGESGVNKEDAAKACSTVADPKRRDDCIFDILATDDLDMAGSYLATNDVDMVGSY